MTRFDWPGSPDDWSLGDDGTLDTVAIGPDGEEYRFSAECAAPYRDEETGLFDSAGWREFIQEEVINAGMEPYEDSCDIADGRDLDKRGEL